MYDHPAEGSASTRQFESGSLQLQGYKMKNLIFYLVIISVAATSAELLALASVALMPELYDQRNPVLARFDEQTLRMFVETRANPSRGWDNPSETVNNEDCLGQVITYTFAPDRTRRHSAAAHDAEIIIAGDSYTLGYETSDQSTFPAVIEKLLNVPVANLGVNGYDPLQSLLKMEQMIESYPKVRIAVLAIMYDDFARLLNSYRPVYFGIGNPYQFKPYISHGQLYPLIIRNPWVDLQTAWKAANIGFDTDYWRKPKPEFPYAASLLSAMSTNWFYYWFIPSHLHRTFHLPKYQLLLNSAAVQEGFEVLIDILDKLATRKHIATLVALIPGSGSDTTSGARLIERTQERKHPRSELINVDTNIDWARYNLGEHGACHPSTYGYEAIATNVARSIQRLTAMPHAR